METKCATAFPLACIVFRQLVLHRPPLSLVAVQLYIGLSQRGATKQPPTLCQRAQQITPCTLAACARKFYLSPFFVVGCFVFSLAPPYSSQASVGSCRKVMRCHVLPWGRGWTRCGLNPDHRCFLRQPSCFHLHSR